MATLNQHITIG